MSISDRPRETTIAEWLDYLADLGLSVYGPCIHLESGELLGGCMDYDAERIVQLRRLLETDGLWHADEDNYR